MGSNLNSFSNFRAEADAVLQEAVHVRAELNKTRAAQESAEAAIASAKHHIEIADQDLTQVKLSH